MSKSLIALAVTAFILGGCSLIPDYNQPAAPVPAQWPQGPAYSPSESAAVAAAELNTRPRKTLGWQTPAEQLTRHASGWTAGPEMNPSTGTARTTIQDHSQPPRCDDGWNPPGLIWPHLA